MIRIVMLCAATAAFALMAAEPTAAADNARKCMLFSQLTSWRAQDAKTIYLRVAQTQYYRLDLANACPLLTDNSAHIINKTSGSDFICGPTDWDLAVSRDRPSDLPSHCIVKAMTPLSAAEADALPKGIKGM